MIIFSLLFIIATVYITIKALQAPGKPTIKEDFRRLFPGKSARGHEALESLSRSVNSLSATLENRVRYHDGKSREADKRLTEDARKTEIAKLNELWAMQIEESINQKDKNE